MKAPTTRQLEVLDAIRAHQAKHGHGPTFRELGEALGIRSTNGVSDHLKYLRKKGLVTWEPYKSRTLRALDAEGAAR